MCDQKRKYLEDRTMEEDDGFGFWIGGVAEVIDVTVGAQGADDGGARRSINGLALGADGDFTVVTDPNVGPLAPDKGPPRARRYRTQDGAFLGDGLFSGGVRSGAELAMDFVQVDVGEDLVEQAVGSFEFADVIGSQEWGQAFLPIVVAAFDFDFGLGCGRVAEGDAVEVERCAELGEGVGVVGVEEGVEVHVEGQWQAVGFEGA